MFSKLPLASQVSRLSCLRLFRVVLSCVSLVYPVFRCSGSFCYSCVLRLFQVVSDGMILSTVVKVFFCSSGCIKFFFVKLCKIVVISLVCFRMFFDVGACFRLF